MRETISSKQKKQLFAQLHISANHDELYIFIRQSYFYEKKANVFLW
jgi:hypothetical protein